MSIPVSLCRCLVNDIDGDRRRVESAPSLGLYCGPGVPGSLVLLSLLALGNEMGSLFTRFEISSPVDGV